MTIAVSKPDTDEEVTMKGMMMLVAAFIVMFATGALAVNWEIVSVKKEYDGQKAKYTMELKDPHVATNVRTKFFNEAQMKEIKKYFNVANTSEMLGYQFIPDKQHEGVIKEINEIE